MIKLRDYRKRSGLTMKKFGELVGSSEASISQYETGRVEPDIELLVKMADTLGVTVDNLIGRTAEENEYSPKTRESNIISNGVDRMPPEDRKRVLDLLSAVYADYFKKEEEKLG